VVTCQFILVGCESHCEARCSMVECRYITPLLAHLRELRVSRIFLRERWYNYLAVDRSIAWGK
jgi:hypothetical protein